MFAVLWGSSEQSGPGQPTDEREREGERGAQSHNLFIDETQSGFSATTSQLPADAMKVLISKGSSAG